MDFSFSEEQGLLQDSIQRYIQNSYTFDARQKILKTEDGFEAVNAGRCHKTRAPF